MLGRLVGAIVLLAMLLVAACTFSGLPAFLGGMPSEAADIAFQFTQERSCSGRFSDSVPIECQDFKTTLSDKRPLSNTDRVNGVEEKWWVIVGFMYWDDPTSDWKEMTCPVAVRKREGTWGPGLASSRIQDMYRWYTLDGRNKGDWTLYCSFWFY